MAGEPSWGGKVRQRDRERRARARIRGREDAADPADLYPEPFVTPLARPLRALVLIVVVAVCAGFWGGLIAWIAHAVG
jgi:hypothetical protein